MSYTTRDTIKLLSDYSSSDEDTEKTEMRSPVTSDPIRITSHTGAFFLSPRLLPLHVCVLFYFNAYYSK